MSNNTNIEVTANLAADQYHSRAGISKTQLGHLLKSASHLRAYLTGPKAEPTKDQIFGTAVHTAALEPDRFATEYVIAPVVDRRTTVGKQIWSEFQAANAGKTVIDPDDRQRALDIAAALRENIIVSGALRSGTPELSVFATADNGLPIKARFDLWDPETNTIHDIKTTQLADRFTFPKEIRKWLYALQASHYLDIARRAGLGDSNTRFIIDAVEKEAPHAVALYEIDAASLKRWDDIRATLFDQWKKAEDIGIYPTYSYAHDIQIIEA